MVNAAWGTFPYKPTNIKLQSTLNQLTVMRKDVYLDELIGILEKEKKLLKQMIKENLQEEDYVTVARYSKGLYEVTGKLNILYFFRDPYKDLRETINRQKKPLLESLKKNKNNEFLTNYYLDMLNQLHRELGTTDMPDESEPFQDSQHIDEACFDLVSGEINAFQLIFTTEKFNMKFERRERNILTWSIGPISVARKKRIVTKWGTRALQNMGFSVDVEADRFIYQYDLSTFRDASALKTLLARVLYDVFMRERGYPSEPWKVELHRDVRE